VDKSLEADTLPAAGSALWDVFVELQSERESGMNGAGRIPLTSIEAWCRLNNVQLTPWEVSTLKAMDGAVLSVWAENRRQAGASKSRCPMQ
jgi:hypothetical protein